MSYTPLCSTDELTIDSTSGSFVGKVREAGQPDQGSPQPQDQALLSAARNGDVNAFGELMTHHRPACLRRAHLMLRNRTDAEDEVQNAFWKAYQRLDQYRGEGPFSAWLTRIVENQCLMRLRGGASEFRLPG
jgi:hypothetical protein